MKTSEEEWAKNVAKWGSDVEKEMKEQVETVKANRYEVINVLWQMFYKK